MQTLGNHLPVYLKQDLKGNLKIKEIIIYYRHLIQINASQNNEIGLVRDKWRLIQTPDTNEALGKQKGSLSQ